MTDKYLFLTYPQRSDAPSPPAIPTIKMSPFLTIDKDDANVTMMQLVSHCGTHLDVPRHVFKDGDTLTDYGPQDFVFHKPMVLELEFGDTHVVSAADLEPFVADYQQADFILFRFGYAEVRSSDKERFSVKAPGFGVEGAAFMRKSFPHLRGIGMDVPSLSTIEYLDDTFAAHLELLGGEQRRFIVVEDMNLEHDLSKIKQLFVAPLLVDQLDGAPCTVFAVVEE